MDQAVELLGYHRKAAIRALRSSGPVLRRVPLVLGRPKAYDPERLMPVLKPIWFAAFGPCGSRLKALLPDWLRAYEQDHRRLDPDGRRCLEAASARRLDRLLAPMAGRVGAAGRNPAWEFAAAEHSDSGSLD